jgi:hypothetical protein
MSADPPASDARASSARERAAMLAVTVVESWPGDAPCSVPALVGVLVGRGLARGVATRAIDDAAAAGRLVLKPAHPADAAWYMAVRLGDGRSA